MSKNRKRRSGKIAAMRHRTSAKTHTLVNRCARCGGRIEPEMLVVGSETCASCVEAMCRANGEWEED